MIQCIIAYAIFDQSLLQTFETELTNLLGNKLNLKNNGQ